LKIRNLCTLLVAGILTFSLGGIANAENKKQKTSTQKVKVTKMDFRGDDIKGTRILPLGDDFTDTKSAKYDSLIRLRTSFVNEILKSATDI